MTDPIPTLLTSVPEFHLRSGLEVCEREGAVAFGSNAWQVFEKLPKDVAIDVFIYPSMAKHFGKPKARWHATLLRHVRSVGGAHPDGMRLRPASTEAYPADNKGHWAIFYEVSGLRELDKDERLGMDRFRSRADGKKFVSNYVPHGPVLVDVV